MIGKLLNNKFGETLFGILISPWLLALPVALIILFFLPPFDKYQAELVKTAVCNKLNSIVKYSDLDGDGVSEKVILFNNQKGEAALKILNSSDVMIQWLDFRGTIYPLLLETGDADMDHHCEIYFISHCGDSLFLNMALPQKNVFYKTVQKFIAPVLLNAKEDDYRINHMNFCDLQSDGCDEIMFHIIAGYALQPRQLYAYDLKNDTVYRGPRMGCSVTFIPTQLDEDPFPEFLGQASSTDNIAADSDIPYKDSSSWFMALDHKLEFLFEPLEFPGHKSLIQTQKFEADDKNNILLLFENMNSTESRQDLMVFTNKGELVRKIDLPQWDQPDHYFLLYSYYPDVHRNILATRNGEYFSVSKNFNLTPEKKGFKDIHTSLIFLNADRDPALEILLLGMDFESFYILRNDMTHSVRVKVPFNRYNLPYFSVVKNGNESPRLFMNQGEREFWFRYGINYLWYAKIPIWVAIYFAVLGFIMIIRRFQVLQMEKAKAREHRLARIQLDQMSSYLDPHFTFNTLNTISSPHPRVFRRITCGYK